MGLESLRGFLRRHRRVALDTSVFIYQLEANPGYLPFTDRVFACLERPGHSAVTSTITMTELLVHPYRSNDEQQVDAFYGLLATYPNLEWIAPSLEIADRAAQLRAMHRLRTPDALQAATAISEEASGLITNDPAFARVETLDTLVLEKLLWQASEATFCIAMNDVHTSPPRFAAAQGVRRDAVDFDGVRPLGARVSDSADGRRVRRVDQRQQLRGFVALPGIGQ